MDAVAALALVMKAIDVLIKIEPIAVKGISTLSEFGSSLYHSYTGVELTDEQRDQMDEKIIQMSNHFQAPIPPADQQ